MATSTGEHIMEQVPLLFVNNNLELVIIAVVLVFCAPSICTIIKALTEKS
jgi:hypothetical protein